DGDHELERREGAVELRAVGRREHGVAGGRHERPNLPLPLGEDLLCQRRDGILPRELGQASDAAPASIEMTLLPYLGADLEQVEGGGGEQGSAGPIEVTGDDVEGVDEPLAEPPERLRTDA